MGALTSSQLVTELQRRLTNLSQDTAVAALNRACRWIARQASYQFMSAASTTLTVNTPTETVTTYSGVITMHAGDSNFEWVSGDTFDTTGAWSTLLGPPPAAPTGHDGLTITINGQQFVFFVVVDSTHGDILGAWPGLDGNFDWSLTVGGVSSTNGPVDLDPGKAKMVVNPDGTPVMHAPLSEFWASLNYNVDDSANFDTYTILSDNTTNPPQHTFLFFPASSGSATLYYHKVLKDLTGGNDYTMFPKDFDDLIVDLAEAEESRIYDSTDTWQILLARAQDQIKLLMDGYKNMTTEPAMQSESASKVQEGTQLGRA